MSIPAHGTIGTLTSYFNQKGPREVLLLLVLLRTNLN
jgi:hypothetical protein